MPSLILQFGVALAVKLYTQIDHPIRLCHNAATQILNTDCRITSIQKFLGHKELSATLMYAWVLDQTVAFDYYSTLARVEKRLELLGAQEEFGAPNGETECSQLITLTAKLSKTELSLETRLDIAA